MPRPVSNRTVGDLGCDIPLLRREAYHGWRVAVTGATLVLGPLASALSPAHTDAAAPEHRRKPHDIIAVGVDAQVVFGQRIGSLGLPRGHSKEHGDGGNHRRE